MPKAEIRPEAHARFGNVFAHITGQLPQKDEETSEGSASVESDRSLEGLLYSPANDE